ncbi:hypothetical protein [Aequorivita antarctica]|uniref:Cytochrome c domain-containing protein n=1 Tax=Aequorivita antarctica TaxID=153266 RepID=A0A5C6Z631_9FLAO|nr:hypothetical protein [Aequorivita antarctica]TXD74981.1 hypothetical protein ESU54_01970 [Aequorivita antarctica]
MKRNLLQITLLCSIMLLMGCTATSEEDLVDTTPIPEIVTYSEDVKPIIDNNCIICHSNPPQNGAPMALANYENVKEAVQNRNLIGRISSDDPAFSMPFGGPRLPQNLIDIIIQWNEDGLIEE